MFLFFFSLDSTVLISIFAGFNMFQSFCKFSCCYVALFVAVKLQDVIETQGGFFFAGFNCLDFYIPWSQHVLAFLHSFLLLCGFVCCCVTTRCY